MLMIPIMKPNTPPTVMRNQKFMVVKISQLARITRTSPCKIISGTNRMQALMLLYAASFHLLFWTAPDTRLV